MGSAKLNTSYGPEQRDAGRVVGQFGVFARPPHWERARPARNEREARKSIERKLLDCAPWRSAGWDARAPSFAKSCAAAPQ